MNTAKFKDFNKFTKELSSLFDRYGLTPILKETMTIEYDEIELHLSGNYLTRDCHIHFTLFIPNDSNEVYDVKKIVI